MYVPRTPNPYNTPELWEWLFAQKKSAAGK